MSATNHIISAAGFMATLGIMLASVLAYANRRLYVYEDPRIDAIDEMLPHANCGACGSPGCRPFAEALVAGNVAPAQCTVNSTAINQTIADLLGIALGHQEKRVARLACAGGSHVARTRARYAGLKSCRGAAVVAGGGKGCSWGCLGLGECAEVCDFDAIRMNAHGLPVVDADLCTACGDCVAICPKDLFSIQPFSHRLWIACSNLADGARAEADCEVACTACERCAVDAPEGLITIHNSIAKIDYTKNAHATRLATERCPTGAIVWLAAEGMAERGSKAKKLVRQTALPVG